jgi:laccase
MKCWSLPGMSVAIAAAAVFFLNAIIPPAAMAAVVEHTFVVSMMSIHGFISTNLTFRLVIDQNQY